MSLGTKDGDLHWVRW